MPIYEYSCVECSSRFQLKQSFDSEPVATCPNCGADSRRLFSPPAIVFKGAGWYATDYRGGYEAQVDNRKEEKEGERETGKSSGDGEKSGPAGEEKAAAPAASSEAQT